MSSWFSPWGSRGELGQTASHLHSTFQQTVTVWSVLSAHPHHGRRGWRCLSATWRCCCWKSGERFHKGFITLCLKQICIFLYHISSGTAAITIGFNCYELCFTAHAREDDICDGVAFQPSYPKHVFWPNHRVCELSFLHFISKLDV